MHTVPLPFQPAQPLQTVFMDCDGTLCLIEGIDYLAEYNGVGASIRQITEQCMAHSGITADLYHERLHRIRPKASQITQLKKEYLRQIAPQARETVHLLHRMNKTVHILSAGIRSALLPLGDYLNISPKRIHAVDLYFTEEGEYESFDRNSPLISPDGKEKIIKTFAKESGTSALIGDGINDLAAAAAVNRFIGYGGLHQYPKIMREADFFVLKSSFSALLPLLLTKEEICTLSEMDKQLVQNGLHLIQQQGLLIRGEQYVCNLLSG